MSTKAPSALPPHPIHTSATRQAIGGSLAVLGGVAAAAHGSYGAAILLGGFGALFAGLGLYTRRTGVAVQPLNTAVNLISTGALAEAEALLDQVESTYRIDYVLRAAAHARALLELRRGAVEKALAPADRAVELPIGFPRTLQRAQVLQVRGLRAFLRACAGDREGARADLDRLRGDPLASPEPLAYAALAEAVLAERGADHAALREVLAKHRRLLLEHTHPRERALVRAWQRMLKTTTKSIYREAAPREVDAQGQPPLVDWIAKIAPAAAPFVQAAPAGEANGAAEPELPIAPAARAAAEARQKAPGAVKNGPGAAKVLGLWVIVVMLFLAVWQFLAPEPPPPGHARRAPPPVVEEPSPLFTVVPALATLVIFAGILAWAMRRAQKNNEALARARTQIAIGDEAAGEQALIDLSRGRQAGDAANAHALLASLAERRGDLAGALGHCDQGLARLTTEQLRAIHADLLVPTLIAERAFVYAATDRAADAAAEIDVLAARHPAYAHLAVVRFRVTLALKARAGDWAGAARLAAANAELAIGARDELLADLARAAANPERTSAAEAARLDEELRVDAEARRWIEAVAPGAPAAFSAHAHGVDRTSSAQSS